MTWFESLTGVLEKHPQYVRDNIVVEGEYLRSSANGRRLRHGQLETPSLAELRKRVQPDQLCRGPTTIREIVANVQDVHADASNAGAMIQVASQFNLLEMVSPTKIPEDGIGIYERDPTQGPACAVAAGAGTIFRNYFVEVNGQIGQSEFNQIDCLAEVGKRLGNTNQSLWEMVNGYALPTKGGLQAINQQLGTWTEPERDDLRGALQIGLQLDTQVTLPGAEHLVSQAFCSAMPVAYSRDSAASWEALAKIVLEAAYEATICAAIENAARTGNNRLFLTLLGGGAFGNESAWILLAIERAILLYPRSGLNVSIVSYRRSSAVVQQMLNSLQF